MIGGGGGGDGSQGDHDDNEFRHCYTQYKSLSTICQCLLIKATYHSSDYSICTINLMYFHNVGTEV